MPPLRHSSGHSAARALAALSAALALGTLTGCTVVTVGAAAVSVTATVVGVAASAAVGTAKVVGKGVGAAYDAMTDDPDEKAETPAGDSRAP